MIQTAVQVEQLCKVYRLGQTCASDRSLGDAVYRSAAKLMQLVHDKGQVEPAERFHALRDVTFSVERGELMGIVGANGAGKSTLLKILSRVTEPTSGRAVIRGRMASLLEVGTGFHPELTGRENIYLNGAILGMFRREVRAKFDEIVEFSGVEKFLDTPVKRYSSGMRVRLAFAVAAHLEPEILIVDEVLAVGDAAFQKKCLGKMRDIATQGGRTVLFVSHNMAAIKALCDRAVLLAEGRVIADAAPEAVVRSYLDTVVDDTAAERFWPDDDQAPGGDELRLRSLRVLDERAQPRETFAVQDEPVVEIGYELARSVRGMRLVLQVLTSEGVVAFASTDHDSRDEFTPAGLHYACCRLPRNLLNGGRYVLAVSAGVPGTCLLMEPRELLAFTVTGAGNHGSYHPETWPGAVAPVLEWTHTASTAGDMHVNERLPVAVD